MDILLIIIFITFVLLQFIKLCSNTMIPGGGNSNQHKDLQENALIKDLQENALIKKLQEEPHVMIDNEIPIPVSISDHIVIESLVLLYNRVEYVYNNTEEYRDLSTYLRDNVPNQNIIQQFKKYYPEGYKTFFETSEGINMNTCKTYFDSKNKSILSYIYLLFALMISASIAGEYIFPQNVVYCVIVLLYKTIALKVPEADSPFMLLIKHLIKVYLKMLEFSIPEFKELFEIDEPIIAPSMTPDSILDMYTVRYRTQKKYSDKNYLRHNPLKKNLLRLKADGPKVLEELNRLHASPMQITKFKCIENRINNQLKDL